MDYQELFAPAPYDQLITCVWFLTGPGEGHVTQPVVPDGRLELVVHLADPFSVLGRDGTSRRQDALLVAGQLTGPIHLVPGRWIDVVGIRLTPLGAHALLAMPLGELTNQVVSLRDLRPALAARLVRAVAAPGTRRVRARGILDVLGRSLARGLDPRMAGAVTALAAGYGGSLKVLASEAGMSPRSMERRFRAEVGLSPKMYQQVVRFRRAFRMLSEAGTGCWAQIAVGTGYYDQAHLIRDFKRFGGTSPRRFFRAQPTLAEVFSTTNHEDTKITK